MTVISDYLKKGDLHFYDTYQLLEQMFFFKYTVYKCLQKVQIINYIFIKEFEVIMIFSISNKCCSF